MDNCPDNSMISEDAHRIPAERNITLNAYFSVKTPDSWTPIFNSSDPVKTEKLNQAAVDTIADGISRIQVKQTGNHTERRLPYAVESLPIRS